MLVSLFEFHKADLEVASVPLSKFFKIISIVEWDMLVRKK